MWLFHKKKKQNKYETIEYNYIIENEDEKELKKIYNKEYSITEIYLQSYCNNTKIKVLELNNDNPIGDIKEKDIPEILKQNLKLGKIIVSFYLDDDGTQKLQGEVYFKKTTTNRRKNENR